MSTLAEIEAAADKLPLPEKQQLFLHLAKKLRTDSSSLPKPRQFSDDQMQRWIDDDEREMRELRNKA